MTFPLWKRGIEGDFKCGFVRCCCANFLTNLGDRILASTLSKSPAQNIALIGFMAVGKSAVGRNLAKKLRCRFVDLDRLIEINAGMKIGEIFAQKGEAFFRQLEKKTLATILQKEEQVIATGGGVIMDDDSLKLLRDRALLIELTASVDVLLSRAGNSSKRPLLNDANRRERVAELLAQREGRYAQARVTIDTSELTVDQVVEKIIQFIATHQ
jgi:shikimate kinase